MVRHARVEVEERSQTPARVAAVQLLHRHSQTVNLQVQHLLSVQNLGHGRRLDEAARRRPGRRRRRGRRRARPVLDVVLGNLLEERVLGRVVLGAGAGAGVGRARRRLRLVVDAVRCEDVVREGTVALGGGSSPDGRAYPRFDERQTRQVDLIVPHGIFRLKCA